MNVIIFGATGMVGQGVLRECLASSGVETVLALGRSASGMVHPKLRDVCHPDLSDLTVVQDQLTGYDACFFCLGSGSTGMFEEDYRRINLEITLSVANTLSRTSPAMTFIYVSGTGAGADKKAMWARVKGEVELALLDLPFKAAYMFRIGYVRPGRGIKSRSKATRFMYALFAPFYPLIKLVFRDAITTTEDVGKAMIGVAQRGSPTLLMENRDINKAARDQVGT